MKYIGVKIIDAVPMDTTEFTRIHHPVIHSGDCQEGYAVVYNDGYISWSPKSVFDEAYRPTNAMTFGLAIEALKKGHRVCRAGWNGKNQYIELAKNISYINASGTVINAQHDAIGNCAIAFVGTSGVQLGWLASQADMLAEDWMVVE